MEITWLGHACFRVKGKSASLLIDPFDPEFIGSKLPKISEVDIVLSTHSHKDHSNIEAAEGDPIAITGPGEYEIKGAGITGISVFHDNTQGSERGKNTVYNINLEGLNLVHLGDLGHVLSEEQIQEIGTCDILFIPVGGVYTIDAKTATEVVSQLEPKIVIPMHYAPTPKIQLEGVETFLKEMGVENSEPVQKLVITKDKLPDEMQVVLM